MVTFRDIWVRGNEDSHKRNVITTWSVTNLHLSLSQFHRTLALTEDFSPSTIEFRLLQHQQLPLFTNPQLQGGVQLRYADVCIYLSVWQLQVKTRNS